MMGATTLKPTRPDQPSTHMRAWCHPEGPCADYSPSGCRRCPERGRSHLNNRPIAAAEMNAPRDRTCP